MNQYYNSNNFIQIKERTRWSKKSYILKNLFDYLKCSNDNRIINWREFVPSVKVGRTIPSDYIKRCCLPPFLPLPLSLSVCELRRKQAERTAGLRQDSDYIDGLA